ncbi:glycosyl transferase [Paracoccus sp. R12_1]|uniref:glycosyltransferase n=1 Tax=unclassified Paracoccus (in: a-proteobacteria) TaxID=2688777 RepID=UPI000C0B0489|nr:MULTISPECIES: glycosyltransferase [unclassified Paracoccus (in: a-proteobacteria)]MBO9455604.1 glycosyl transferase [Paracoccus sp. R12_2]MBO9486274.1 glycosyl transferase [Paracoccus sp. R12_1]PHQ69421.1 MAG: glycosyl transferase [Paracoccus sp. (in: a-proteobacteria)]
MNTTWISPPRQKASTLRRVSPLEGLSAETSALADHAYVTLVSNPDYLPGAEALLRSLRLTGSKADLVVMHRGLNAAHLARLRALGARLIAADLLPTSEAFDRTHARDALHKRAAFTRGGKPDFHTPLDNFVKLRLWQLDYDRCVFIDADAVVLRPVDKLFEMPEFCAAPNVYDGLDGFHRMNSGVFTARPDPRTYDDMLARLDRPGVFWRRTDQSFLQDYFQDWQGLSIHHNMLQYVWFNMPELWSWEDIRILHFQYEKPWQDHDKVPLLKPLIDLWRAIAAGQQMPDLAAQVRPAA